MDSEKMHIPKEKDAILGFIDAGDITPRSQLREEFGKIQEFWIWKHWKSVQCYEHDERIFLKDSANPL